AQFPVELQRLPVAEAAPLLVVRLEKFRAPFVGVDEVEAGRRRDPFFPLGAAWLDTWRRDRIDFRPRDLLNAARRGWEEPQRGLRGQPAAPNDQHAYHHGAAPLRTETDEHEAIEQTVRRRLDDLWEREKEGLQSSGWDPDGLADVLKGLIDCWLRREGHWP